MTERHTVLLEGYTVSDILGVPSGDLDALVFVGEPILIRMGTAELLGQFRRTERRLVVELAQIDGGGEGVLPTLSALARRYAAREGLAEIEWIVHRVSCTKPSLKLCRILERRGFILTNFPGVGRAYHAAETVDRSGSTV